MGRPKGSKNKMQKDNDQNIGMQEPKYSHIVKDEPIQRTKKYQVFRSDDDGNNDLMISVNVLLEGGNQHRKFAPGEVVDLTKAQVEALNNANIENELIIPETSGIYEARDPIQAARANYPGMQIRRDPVTQRIIAKSFKPQYIIRPVI